MTEKPRKWKRVRRKLTDGRFRLGELLELETRDVFAARSDARRA